MTKPLNRRRLLTHSAWGSMCTALAPLALAQKLPGKSPTPATLAKDPKGILDLAPGFHYTILQRQGATMSDGLRVPALPDAMGVFTSKDKQHLILMRNHEIPLGQAKSGPLAPGQQPTASQAAHRYAATGYGGVSRLVLDPKSYEVLRSNMVLWGTDRNCAGGLSPWGWLSCEESLVPGHGLTFLCDPEATSLQKPNPIAAYGRMQHEAATVTPGSHIAYLTEDQYDSCFYRFLPDSPQTPFSGQLQALAIKGHPGFDTSKGLPMGKKNSPEVAATWITIAKYQPGQPAPEDPRHLAQKQGAARFVRGEGLWRHDPSGTVFFSCTEGGPAAKGQIFAYQPDASGSDGSLRLVTTATDTATLNMPDNIVTTKKGGLIVAEDPYETPCLRYVTPGGEVSTLARNALSKSEFTGVCLAPQEDALFVNMQKDGLTLVIKGPFASLPV